jgi:hypothetical protein
MIDAGPLQFPFWLIFGAIAVIYTLTVFRDALAPDSGGPSLSKLDKRRRWTVFKVHATILIFLGAMMEGLRLLVPWLPRWITVTHTGSRAAGSVADIAFLAVLLMMEEIERQWLSMQFAGRLPQERRRGP